MLSITTTYSVPACTSHPELTDEFPSIKRQYTLTCEQDEIDIREGYCPKYAIWWDENSNRLYWPKWWKIRHRPEYQLYKKRVIRERVLAISSFHWKIPCVALSRSKSDSIVNYNKHTTKQHTIKSVRFEIFKDIIPIPNIPSMRSVPSLDDTTWREDSITQLEWLFRPDWFGNGGNGEEKESYEQIWMDR